MDKLAIISTNSSQYSETFIKTQIDNLPFDIILFTDGYFPKSISRDKGSTVTRLSDESKWWQSKDVEKILKRSFKANGVKAVIAQYGPSGVELMNVCEQMNLPLIVHFHGYDAYRNDVLGSYGKKYVELFQKASAIIGVSRDMCSQLKHLGCSKKKIHYVPYGVDTALFKPTENTKELSFVACGRFVEKKGPLYTVKAFRRVVDVHPTVNLTMIGDGELLKDAESLVHELGLSENVQFAGVLDQAEVSRIFRRSFAFIQHSMRTEDNDSEGTPLVILEACASGLPVVATRHAGIEDVIIEAETGFLVAEGDYQAMSKKMIQLIENPEKSRDMGRRGREVIESSYRTENYIAGLKAVIQSCLIQEQ